jgi:hypothetical protein
LGGATRAEQRVLKDLEHAALLAGALLRLASCPAVHHTLGKDHASGISWMATLLRRLERR